MSLIFLKIVLDVIVLLALGFTMFYAMTLSKSLRNFKVHRKEFKTLLDELSHNIDDAQSAIRGLEAAGKNSGARLQELIDESRQVADDLKYINQSGDNLAERLDTLRGSATKKQPSSILDKPYRKPDDTSSPSAKQTPNAPSFAIKDRDYGEPFESQNDHTESADDFDEDMPDTLKSDAEKELFRALKRNRRT